MIDIIRAHRTKMNYSNDVQELWQKLGEEIKEFLDEVFKGKVTTEFGHELDDIYQIGIALLDSAGLDMKKISMNRMKEQEGRIK